MFSPVVRVCALVLALGVLVAVCEADDKKEDPKKEAPKKEAPKKDAPKKEK